MNGGPCSRQGRGLCAPAEAPPFASWMASSVSALRTLVAIRPLLSPINIKRLIRTRTARNTLDPVRRHGTNLKAVVVKTIGELCIHFRQTVAHAASLTSISARGGESIAKRLHT